VAAHPSPEVPPVTIYSDDGPPREYERLDVPGHDGDGHYSKVDAGVTFRFYGQHGHAAAVAEAESRLALVPGIDIVDMHTAHPLARPLPETAAEYARRIAAALDAIGQMYPHGDVHRKDKTLDTVIRALTGDGTPASTYRQWCQAHPKFASRVQPDDH